MPTNGPTAKTYPTEEQYAAWKEHADELDMTVSEFISSMVEAGRKKFDVEVEPDEELYEVREQRNDCRRELERARDRIDSLEDQLYTTERAKIETFVADNPGCTWEEVVQELVDTADEWAMDHLDAMEGESIRRGPAGRFYPIKEEP